MVLTKTPICNFGEKAKNFNLLSTENKKLSFNFIDDTNPDVLPGQIDIEDAIKETKIENLKLISSNVDLSGLEVETAGDSRRAFKLKDELASILNDSGASYDYILIDCPPSLSLLTINAFAASDSLLVPVQCEFYAMVGLAQLKKTIDLIKIINGGFA